MPLPVPTPTEPDKQPPTLPVTQETVVKPGADARVRVAGDTADGLARREEELAATFKRLHDALDRIGF